MTVERLPGESVEYRKLRAELLQAEIALKEQRERVAELRRRLPLDTPLPTDWVLREGPRDLASGDEPVCELPLSELVGPKRTLVLMHFMFGGAQENPCPMCTMWADGYDGVVPHLQQHVDFGVVVAGDLSRIRGHARTRGWRNVRLLSCEGSTMKSDLAMETPDGGQLPGVSVFARRDGAVRHFYTGSAIMADGHYRGMDLLSPVWNFLDLLPDGRPDWMPSLDYGSG